MKTLLIAILALAACVQPQQQPDYEWRTVSGTLWNSCNNVATTIEVGSVLEVAALDTTVEDATHVVSVAGCLWRAEETLDGLLVHSQGPQYCAIVGDVSASLVTLQGLELEFTAQGLRYHEAHKIVFPSGLACDVTIDSLLVETPIIEEDIPYDDEPRPI